MDRDTSGPAPSREAERMAALIRALENPGPPQPTGTWEATEAVPYVPVVSSHPPVGGHYPAPLPGPPIGTSACETLREWSGIIAQGAAFLLLATLAFAG